MTENVFNKKTCSVCAYEKTFDNINLFYFGPLQVFYCLLGSSSVHWTPSKTTYGDIRQHSIDISHKPELLKLE